jgi:hypothetical protein
MLLALARRVMRRPPDFVIGGRDRPYMERWWLIPRNPWFNVYLHRILRSDDDRALHDHPWVNCSILLDGSYVELVPARRGGYAWGAPTTAKRRRAGAVVLRRARAPHRLVLDGGAAVISLFVTGPRTREWGFYAEHGWVHWQAFTDPDDPGLYRPR